ncbi:MAG: PaaX family transcriptional regulator C-terminal domain-containing protein [Chloroflexota bacterium]
MAIEKIPNPTNNISPLHVFSLFADYFVPYGNGHAWTQEILYLLGLLGQSEQAARSMLLRMRRRGWLDVERVGRRTRYQLSTAGLEITKQGDSRLFEPAAEEWDGTWQLVIYSLSEEKRPLRTELRKKLVWFGFGNLAAGTWITPHNRRAEMAQVFKSLGVEAHVFMFEAQRIEALTNGDIVARCWDLANLEAQYAAFVAHWRPRLAAFDNGAVASAEERFKQRFQLTFAFHPFPRIDPNLPTALLPSQWSGHRARQILTRYRALLDQGLPEFIGHLST